MLVVDGGGTLVGVVTPDSLVEHVVAAGLDPRTTPVSAAGGEPPLVLDADLSLDDGYRLLEEAEVERAPVARAGQPRRRALAVGRPAAPGGGRSRRPTTSRPSYS